MHTRLALLTLVLALVAGIAWLAPTPVVAQDGPTDAPDAERDGPYVFTPKYYPGMMVTETGTGEEVTTETVTSDGQVLQEATTVQQSASEEVTRVLEVVDDGTAVIAVTTETNETTTLRDGVEMGTEEGELVGKTVIIKETPEGEIDIINDVDISEEARSGMIGSNKFRIWTQTTEFYVGEPVEIPAEVLEEQFVTNEEAPWEDVSGEATLLEVGEWEEWDDIAQLEITIDLVGKAKYPAASMTIDITMSLELTMYIDMELMIQRRVESYTMGEFSGTGNHPQAGKFQIEGFVEGQNETTTEVTDMTDEELETFIEEHPFKLRNKGD